MPDPFGVGARLGYCGACYSAWFRRAATDGFFFSGLGHSKTLVGGSGTIQGGFLFGAFLGELILKFAHLFVFIIDYFSFKGGDGGTAGSFFLLDPFFLL